MSAENIYTQTLELYNRLGHTLPREGESALPPVSLAHYPITDTGLAACLGTMGIPFREPAPFTDDLDELTGRRQKSFWLSSVSQGPENHSTEQLIGYWTYRARCEAEHPLHPFVHMRAALDARAWWLNVMHHRGSLRTEARERRSLIHLTTSLREASILKASGFVPRAFTGRAFLLSASPASSPASHTPVNASGATPAAEILRLSQLAEGATPPQWMHRVLVNYDSLLTVVKATPPVVSVREGDQTVILTEDSTPATRDKFFALL